MKHLLIATLAILLGACGSGNKTTSSDDENPSPKKLPQLSLFSHQDIFTTPSRFELTTSHANFRCTQAVLVYSTNRVFLPISPGSWFSETNKFVCSLGNLPENISSAERIEILFEEITSSKDRKSETAVFSSIASQITILEKSSYINLTEKNKTFSSPRNFTEDKFPVNIAHLDISGAASSIQYILKNKFGLSFTEREVMQQLFEHGERENIIARRGFSLLDIKRLFSHHNLDATGYLMPHTPPPVFDTESRVQLNTDAPFIAPIQIYGTPAFITVTQVAEDYLTGIHPILGYIKIPLDDINNKHFLTTKDGLIVMIIKRK